jgi:hypothetical protein
MLAGLVFWSLGGYRSAASAQGGDQGSPAFVRIGSSSEVTDAGKTVEFLAVIHSPSTDFAGSVRVTVPAGLTVVGQPFCNPFWACGWSLAVSSAGTEMESRVFQYAGETTSFTFRATVDATAPPGSVYEIAAALLGDDGTPVDPRPAVATLTVEDDGTRVTPEGEETGVPPSASDRDAYLSVTPTVVRIAPGGSTLYFVQPIFWGAWGDDLPGYTVEVRLPAGASLSGEPVCGPRQSAAPSENTCEVGAEERSDGATVIASGPGFSDGNPNGLYVTVGIDSDVPVGTLLEIDASLRVAGDASGSSRDEQSLGALVVDPSGVSSRDGRGAVSGLLELRSGYSRQGETCGSVQVSGGTELALYEWGGAMLASAEVSPGRIGTASDGTGRDACVLAFAFGGVPEFSVYMLSSMPVGDAPPCRACVLGLVTPSDSADQVIVLQVGPGDASDTPAVEATSTPAVAVADTDLGGISDEDEAALGTNHTEADTDGDGAFDRDEVLAGTDPLDPNSF